MAWNKGQSGNIKGRPPATGRAAKARAMLEPNMPGLIKKVVEMALSGDMAALKLCIDKLVPSARESDDPVSVPLSGNTFTEKGHAILDALAAGKITVDDAARLMAGLGALARLTDIDNHEQRLKALEDRKNG